MDSIFFLFLAYTLIWGLIFGYSLKLGKRQAKVAQEITLIKESLSRKD